MRDQQQPAEISAFPASVSLASAYIPWQNWETPCMPCEALKAGTVFPSLVMPFTCGKGGAVHDAAVTSVFFTNAKG